MLCYVQLDPQRVHVHVVVPVHPVRERDDGHDPDRRDGTDTIAELGLSRHCCAPARPPYPPSSFRLAFSPRWSLSPTSLPLSLPLSLPTASILNPLAPLPLNAPLTNPSSHLASAATIAPAPFPPQLLLDLSLSADGLNVRLKPS